MVVTVRLHLITVTLRWATSIVVIGGFVGILPLMAFVVLSNRSSGIYLVLTRDMLGCSIAS